MVAVALSFQSTLRPRSLLYKREYEVLTLLH